MISRHLKLSKISRLSTWRRVALNSWSKSFDPQTYGLLAFDATKLLEFVSEYRKQTGQKISPTHIVGKALALAIEENPEVNCVVRGSNLYKRDSIDIFFQVALDDEGKDLSGLVVKEANRENFEGIIKQMAEEAKSLREGRDKSFEEVKKQIRKTPSFLMRPMLKIIDFILYRLNIWSPLLGVKKDPFGSAMVTNVSQFGVEHGFVPLPAISHTPLILAVFKAEKKPVVEDDEIKIKQMLQIGVTLDHRVIDGVYGGKIVKSLKKYIENPYLIN